jgi:hypothetical protein
VLTRAYGQGEAKSKCASCGEDDLARVKVSQLGGLPLRDGEGQPKSFLEHVEMNSFWGRTLFCTEESDRQHEIGA